MIVQKKNLRKKYSKYVLFVYFFVYIWSQKRCIYALVIDRMTKKMREKKVKWKEREPIGLYKVSSSLFFSNCYFVHDCYVSNLFPCSSGDSFSSLLYRSCYSYWSASKDIYVNMAVDIHILSLSFSFLVCIYKRLTPHFLTSMNRKKKGMIIILFRLYFISEKLSQDKFVYLCFLFFFRLIW